MGRREEQFQRGRNRMRRGILLVPSLFTTGVMVAGIYALLAAINGFHYKAGAATIIAMILDGLDGRIARMTSSSSAFGKEYDSLSDLMAFGIAPATLLYTWALRPFGRIGWVAVFLFVICGALRLARFNIQSNSKFNDGFTGLPIPAAAGLIASSVMLAEEFSLFSYPPGLGTAILAYILAFLMVSNVPYNDFKRIGWKDRKPFSLLVGSVLVLVVVATFPHVTLFLGLFAYVFLGPIAGFWKLVVVSRRKSLSKHVGNPTKP